MDMAAEESLARAIDAFDRMSRLFASLEGVGGRTGLTKAEIVALEALSKQGRLKMSELARSLGMSFSAATKTVDRLIGRELVARERNHGDRRVVRVGLTKGGAGVVRAYQREQARIFRRLIGVLTPGEGETLLSLLEKIAKAVEGDAG